MKRRTFLTLLAAGGASVLLPACDDMPASATAPWQGPATDEADPRVRVLAWALLAPNPHNLQPWIADVRVADTIMLSLDPRWQLPGTDPYGRQILIGCGAFLELLRMAAAQDGYRAQTTLFPDGPYGETLDARPFARVRLERDPAVAPDRLFAYVRQRRTTRSAFEPRPVEPAVQQQIAAAVQTPGLSTAFSASPAQNQRLGALAADGLRVEFATPSARADTERVIRVGAAQIAQEPSGITVHGTAIWWGQRFGMIDAQAIAEGMTKSIDQMIDAVQITPLWVWQTSADNRRESQLAAGRAYLRLCLAATAAGVAIHPCSQILQEFPEMDALYTALHDSVGVAPPGRVQMLARLGYATPVGPSARRPVQKLLRT